MAPSPLRRDYSLGGEFFETNIRRTPSLKAPLDPISPQTFILRTESVASSETEDTSTFGLDGLDGADHNGAQETLHARSTDEPILDGRQIDMLSIDSARPTISMDAQRKRTFSPSVTSASVLSDGDGRRSNARSSTKMPEFFSQTVFQTCLQNPTISHQLLRFSQSRLAGENMEFLARVQRHHALVDEVRKSMYETHRDYISSRAPNQINIEEQSLLKVNSEAKTALQTTLPLLESVWQDAQADVERLVFGNIYSDFVRQQMSLSAAKALGNDQNKYAGLGDCFVLTDPSKADNPIVFASDGFVKVTGYSRSEIIPRNCRFLQGQHTDQSSIRRLKRSIEHRQESVELLLNLRKDGSPFWNLLYTTPLFSQTSQGHDRQPIFFLGGQINCSSTIHNQSDVLRILSQSKEEEQPATQLSAPPPLRQPRSQSFLNAFRRPSRMSAAPQKTPGMENILLNQMEEVPLESQINKFYTAYSNYIIINYSTWLISFISAGLADTLFPIKAKSALHAHAIGADVFKFLSNHGTGSLNWEFKSSVKSALKMGNAITLDLKLCARPLMGLERFALHWTPLKDEGGAVGWIVLTLGNEHRVGMAY
ncbi:uncharacterized protein LTR77_009876 [Saxophila tyrrhenica]|uniref:LOV domain-containing protein n=1 Tax=Saxophila tyrrhenica TaxID=1690608 RepID=A0AAV9P1D4_9PEZI|nr:hypothetical protein LTR77_009876 [Saxophila tyrrhenica]